MSWSERLLREQLRQCQFGLGQIRSGRGEWAGRPERDLLDAAGKVEQIIHDIEERLTVLEIEGYG